MFNLKRLLYRIIHGVDMPVKRPIQKPQKIEPQRVLRYALLDTYEGGHITLEAAYRLYKKQRLARVLKNGEEKVYMELMLDKDLKYYGPCKVYDRI